MPYRFGLHVTANYPKQELEERDTKSYSGIELLEAIALQLLKHEDVTSFQFIVTRDPK